MSTALSEVATLVRRECGTDFGASQLAAAVARLSPTMTPERLLAAGHSEELLKRLINEVTVRETFFFRHRSEFEGIDWPRALERANARGSASVRVWVAGCASGEEAYTLAILACEAFACGTPPVRLLATDIATAALERGRSGRYAARSTATVSEDLRRRYFTVDDELLAVADRLKRLVEFRAHNLVRDLAPVGADGGFDVISCRNVLIYFDRPTMERVVRLLQSALAPDGILILGATDRLSARRLPVSAAKRPAPSERPQRAAQSAARRGPPEALSAADRGDLALALEITAETLARGPLRADAHYVCGVAELACGDARAAIASLRRAVYIDPDFSPALFKLARAHEALGAHEAARQVYERTLRSLTRSAQTAGASVHTVDLADIAVACHARLA
jgi:chemotaxis protein methyltransferase CheR